MMELTPIQKLSKDIKQAISGAAPLSRAEARFLVDAYYMMQENRIRNDAQIRSMSESQEPHDVLNWLAAQSDTLETQVRQALDRYSNASELGRWARSITGIGPVIAAGLLSHIDIEKAPTVGHIWRFAGLDPTTQWGKGEKRPWNAALKTLCWKAGESFVKVSGHDEDIYGKIYLQRKAYEQQKNDAGEYRDQAEVGAKRVGKNTDAYKHYAQGKLSPGHIHARAKRYAVKLFLSHYHEKAYELHYGKKPPLPYPIAILGHAHKI